MVYEHRRYLGDSVRLIKNKNPEAAKLSESGGVKISGVQGLGSRECVCLNERI